MALTIPVDESEPMTELEEVPEDLEGLKALIGGGWIEFVHLPDGSSLMIDEEGKLKGFPMNRRATRLWWQAVPEAQGVDVICGPAVFFNAEETRRL